MLLFLLPQEAYAAGPYNASLVSGGNWFNSERITPSRTSGIFLYLLVTIIFISLIAYAEHVGIPAYFFILGSLIFFYGIYLFATISAIVGIGVIITSFLIMVRGKSCYDNQ